MHPHEVVADMEERQLLMQSRFVFEQNLGNLRRNAYTVFRLISLYLRCPLNVVIVPE